ncbi:cytochrome d ubiquinol oxidase subunit II [Marinomonas mediterranea]|jgi:cytochrome bd quinol oxidase subunit 2 apoprotein (EC 1.10.3.-)|uniref:Cytochrome d ubiquinol oxidase, subunit II n=1 Tax=Marinomonas mediterranea (strain ATCC 700492 / JCM 21426 / NBRC 103028 / MMB-1) TaxID=717774 RepID=F2JXW8_MARM1|nr:cytochrome d ubiquinol oxidase subunit II [Marinomonas mediterranea]ADZ89617.1 cytochrome d ubiquinol oxidase, subunit II [Marinomonas mediterranea MMB-1]WCN07708.1 cytochrome d ubiquinol oxidase subunit II [Marinomonas mediterranea]WCN11809.1 cytochrome d ubiquinol oxidase subunit II [Marinomonas mediterranea]WCN15858.1 cytochrome d ubiquinol oxidase subunit II [Marinomonas mediterranea MMB-1]
MDLALFYFLILGFAVFMYVLLDGFDLGIGILYPWFESKSERDHLMRSISHVWDGNETWLVFGGVMLFAAFPAAYAGITSTFYLPIMLMLFALIFRGVAFEYRFKADRSRPYWDLAFSAGSAIAAFCQGILLGSLVQGIPEGSSMIASWHWLTPFTILTGFSVMAGYALMASSYLFMKSRSDIQRRASHLGKNLLICVVLAMLTVSIWTTIASPEIQNRWFENGHFIYLSPLPIISLFLSIGIWKHFTRHQMLSGQSEGKNDSRPFWYSAGLFLTGFIGLVVSLFPYLIPRQLTLWEAAAPDSSLTFLLVGVCLFIPLILAYTLWGYRVFSGKVEDYQEGY